MKQKVEIEIEVPDGFVPSGEWRAPKLGEPFLLPAGSVGFGSGQPASYLILRQEAAPGQVWSSKWSSPSGTLYFLYTRDGIHYETVSSHGTGSWDDPQPTAEAAVEGLVFVRAGLF